MSAGQDHAGSLTQPFGLAQVQRWMQTVITHPDGVEVGAKSDDARSLIEAGAQGLGRVVTRSEALSETERLEIYANAYFTRLLECLGEVFPVLKRTLGEEAFNGFAFGYLQEHPSRSYTLNGLGRHFPGYLAQTRPSPGERSENGALPADWPGFLIDLARFEWVIYEVFDGPGVEGKAMLQSEALLEIAPHRWGDLCLKPVLCLQLLATEFPINDFYTAARQAEEEEPIPIPSAEESWVAITRRDFVVRRYALSKAQYELLSALQQGRPLGEAVVRASNVARMSMDDLAAQLQLWFRDWTADSFFESCSLI